MRTIKILLFVLLFPFATIAQTLTQSAYDKLNVYVSLSNDAGVKAMQTMDCLMKFYNESKNSVKRNQSVLVPICSESLTGQYLNESVLSPDQAGLDLTLMSKAKQTTAEFDELIKIAREVEIYVKLEEYKTDFFKKSDRLISDAIVKYARFRSLRTELNAEIFKFYLKRHPLKSGNKYIEAEQYMLNFLSAEASLMEQWAINFDEETFTSAFPDYLVQKMINEIDLEPKPQVKQGTLIYPLGYFFQQFIDAGANDCQAQKRNSVNGYNSSAKKSDHYSNKALRDLLNYHNNMLVPSFEAFSKQSNLSKTMILRPFKYCLQYKLDTVSTNYEMIEVRFQDTEIPPISLVGFNQECNKPVVSAMNNYIEFVNELIRTSIGLSLQTSTLCKDIDDYLQGKRKSKPHSFYPDDNYFVPRTEYEKAKNDSRVFPAEIRKNLNKQLDDLLTLVLERDQYIVKIEHYLGNKTYETDNYEICREYIARISLLTNMFDTRKQRLYNDLRSIWAALKQPDSSSPWLTSGESLISLYDEKFLIFETYKQIERGDSALTLPSTEKLKENFKKSVVSKYDNLKNLEEYGRNNGNCPHSRYDDITSDTKTFAELSEKQNAKLPKKPYHELIWAYNNSVENYNRFTEIALNESDIPQRNVKSAYLLQLVKQPFLVICPNTKQNNPYIPENEQKTDTLKTNSESNNNSQNLVPAGAGEMDGYAVNNMILLLDVSASMEHAEKLPLLKKSFLNLLKIFRKEDKVGLISYSGQARVLLNPISSQNETVQQAVDDLTTGGATNINSGLRLAYETAQKSYIPGGNNRIILATDGAFYVSPEIFALVEQNTKKGIHLSIFLYGKAKPSESLLKLASISGNAYVNVTPENADKVFITEAKALKLK